MKTRVRRFLANYAFPAGISTPLTFFTFGSVIFIDLQGNFLTLRSRFVLGMARKRYLVFLGFNFQVV